MMRPPSTELLSVPGSTVWWPAADEPDGSRLPGVLVFSLAAPVNFTNADFIHDRLLAAIDAASEPVRLVVLEASGVTDFDYTGSQALQTTIGELRAKGIDVAMARLIVTHAQQAAVRSGLAATLGGDRIFKSVDEALRALHPAGKWETPARAGVSGEQAP
jgi:MFS superfamily sulfate permease-like transporter